MHACVTEEQVDCVSKVLGKEWLFSITLSTYLPKFSHFVFVQRKYNYNAQLVFLLNFLSTSMYLFFFWPFESWWTDFLLHFPTLFSILLRQKEEALEKFKVMLTTNDKREFVPRDQVFRSTSL